jgi:hypothetical protein
MGLISAIEANGRENEVEIASPVVHPRDMRLLQCIVYSQWMETEDLAQDGLTCLRRLFLEIHPEQPARLFERGRESLELEVGARVPTFWSKENAYHHATCWSRFGEPGQRDAA